MLTLYHTRGGVIATDFTYTDPSDIGAGGTAPFDAFTNRFDGLNRYTLSVQGQR